MKKQGVSTYFFYFLLLFFFIIAGGILIFSFQSEYRFAEPDEGIGFRQAAVLQTYKAMDDVMLYTHTTAKLAASEALGTYFASGLLASYGGSACGIVGSYQAWSNASQPCFPVFSLGSDAFANHLTSAINRRWRHPVVRRPPSYAYQIGPNSEEGQATVYGLAAEEVSMPVVGVKRGSASQASMILSGGGDGLIWPTKVTRISSCFGIRTYGDKYHDGIDISDYGDADMGNPVWAIADGIVIDVYYEWVGDCACSRQTCPLKCRDRKSYGNSILIKHSNELLSRYSHLSEITIQKDQEVKKGERIGAVGSTGDSTASHLDLKIYTSPTKLVPEGAENPFCFYDDGVLAKITFKQGSNCDDYGSKLTHAEEPLKAECEDIEIPMVSSHCGVGSMGTIRGAPQEVKNAEENIKKYSEQLNIDIMDIIKDAAKMNKVDPAFLLGQITAESGGNPYALSPVGAGGIAQFMPSTASGYPQYFSTVIPCQCRGAGNCFIDKDPTTLDCSSDDRFKPEKEIYAQAAYIRDELDYYDFCPEIEKYTYAAASYNAGRGNIIRLLDRAKAATGKRCPTWNDFAAQIIHYNPTHQDEVRGYAPKVMAYAEAWGGGFSGGDFYCDSIAGKELGSLRFPANFNTPIIDPTTEVTDLIAKARDVFNTNTDNLRSRVDIPNFGKWQITGGFCRNSEPLELYFNEILMGLQECLLNGQKGCTCDPLPDPSVIRPATLNDGTYELRIGSIVSLSKDGEAYSAPFEIVERYRADLHEPTTITVEFQVSNNVVVNRKVWYDAQGENSLTFKHPNVSKIHPSLIGLRDLPADDWLMQSCLPTKRLHAYCAIGTGIRVLNESSVADNPYLKFGITLNDRQPPVGPGLVLYEQTPEKVMGPLNQFEFWKVVPITAFSVQIGAPEADVSGVLFYCSEKDGWPQDPVPERFLHQESYGRTLSIETCGGLPIDYTKDYQMVARTVDRGGNVGPCSNALWYVPSAVEGKPVLANPYPMLVRDAPRPVLCW